MATEAEALTILRTELADPKYQGKTLLEVRDLLLGRPLVVNPEVPGLVPAPFTADDVKAAVADYSSLPAAAKTALYDILTMQNHPGLAVWAQVWLDGNDAASVTAIAQATIPDPNYEAEIPGACRLEDIGLADITHDDGSVTHCGLQRSMLEEAPNG